jgi:hypothetical protein
MHQYVRFPRIRAEHQIELCMAAVHHAGALTQFFVVIGPTIRLGLPRGFGGRKDLLDKKDCTRSCKLEKTTDW